MRIRLQCGQRAAGASTRAGTRSSESGDTFTRFLVTTGILAAMSVSLYGTLSAGWNDIQSMRENVKASRMVMQKAEALCLVVPGQAADSNNAPNAPRASTSTVTVRMSWTNYCGGKPIVHERDVQARLARNGMPKYLWGTL